MSYPFSRPRGMEMPEPEPEVEVAVSLNSEERQPLEEAQLEEKTEEQKPTKNLKNESAKEIEVQEFQKKLEERTQAEEERQREKEDRYKKNVEKIEKINNIKDFKKIIEDIEYFIEDPTPGPELETYKPVSEVKIKYLVLDYLEKTKWQKPKWEKPTESIQEVEQNLVGQEDDMGDGKSVFQYKGRHLLWWGDFKNAFFIPDEILNLSEENKKRIIELQQSDVDFKNKYTQTRWEQKRVDDLRGKFNLLHRYVFGSNVLRSHTITHWHEFIQPKIRNLSAEQLILAIKGTLRIVRGETGEVFSTDESTLLYQGFERQPDDRSPSNGSWFYPKNG